ncbi:MAG: hypothetical protein E3J43_02000 [Candidatus Heimdallarchaeota archaeon]|nr:MAG: hypothetical protein E3J43_02000 [Candidatus Heimdallarchaeota archaeon]
MKISVIGDLHGSNVYLRYILRKIRKTDALFIAGDIAGTISYCLILKSIFKSKKISREKYTELVYDKYLPQFIEFQKKSTRKMFKILSKASIPVFYTHGNSDSEQVIEVFKEYSENSPQFYYLGDSTVKHENLIVVGYGFCSPAEYRTPFQTPGEKDKDEISKDLIKLENKILEYEKNKTDLLIGLFHEPPKDTKLDYIGWSSTHSGSELIQNHTLKIPYDLVFAGHIHESQNCDIQKETILVNPGPLVNGKWAIVDTKKRTVSLRKIPIMLSIRSLIYRSRETFK